LRTSFGSYGRLCPVAERVVDLELGVVWDPNAPDAVLVAQDLGAAALALRADIDDADDRWVVLRWPSARAAVMEPPNDEAISGHRLYRQGLDRVRWAGEVLESEWIATLEWMNRVHPYHRPEMFEGLRHFVILTKEAAVEVVAPSQEILRVEATSAAQAALAATSPT
jgi:hypothetical protein